MPRFIKIINNISMVISVCVFSWMGIAVPRDDMPLSFFFTYYIILFAILTVSGGIWYFTDKYIKDYNHMLIENERRRRNREARRNNRLRY